MAQLYLLHEICTNKTFAVQMETYDTNHNSNEMREGKKKYHQNNVIQTQMQAEFNITIFLCSVMTTDALYNAIWMAFLFSIFWLLFVFLLCWLLYNRLNALCVLLFFLLEREQPKSKKLISMTHILSVEILSCRILFSCIQNGAHEIQLRAACFDFERKYSCVCYVT